MKVCHYSGITLIGQFFVKFARELPNHGIDLSFSSFLKEEKPEWLKGFPEIDFYNLQGNSRLDYPQAIIKLARYLKREKTDILHIHFFDGGLTGIPAAYLAQTCKIVYTRHYSDLNHLIGKKRHIFLDRQISNISDKSIAVSQTTKDFMIEKDGIAESSIDVIPIGFDFDEMNIEECEVIKIRREFGLEDKFVIGCVASFQILKGHYYLLKSFAQIIKSIPQARLLLVGDGDRTEINKYIENLRLTDKVIFAGHRKDVLTCIKAMNLLVQPSLSESFCQVIVEAMGVGTPLITTDVGIAREIITDGKNGFLIEPKDADSISKNIIKLYNSPQLCKNFSISGKESVVNTFTFSKMIGEHVRLYKHLLENRN